MRCPVAAGGDLPFATAQPFGDEAARLFAAQLDTLVPVPGSCRSSKSAKEIGPGQLAHFVAKAIDDGLQHEEAESLGLPKALPQHELPWIVREFMI
jgi:hypothetical protein